MGNAAIWYYPAGSTLKKIDLGRRLSSIVDWPLKDRATSRAATGSVSGTTWETSRRVRMTMELFSDYTVVAELETLESHLTTGGSITLTEDDDYCVCGFLQYPPEVGTTAVELWANQFAGYGGVSTGTGDAIVLQGPSPKGLREIGFISSRSGTTVTLSDGVTYDWRDEAFVLFRDRRFWPVLHLVEGQESSQLIRPTDGRRLTWELSLELEERAASIQALAVYGYDNYWPGTTDPTGGAIMTIEDALKHQVSGSQFPGDAPVGF